MAKLYLITGAPGAGKTTISYALAEKLAKSAVIQGDDFYNQVVGGHISPWKEGNHLELFWELVIYTIKKYLDNDYDVIFNYIINDVELKKLKEIFKEYETKFTVLMADGDVLVQRDSERPEDCQMKERCKLLLEKFENYDIEKRHYLKEDVLTISEVCEEIINNDQYKI